jgi:hypothetical protein
MTFEPAQEGQRTTVVVYDRTTGEIIHVHEVLTERGGRHPSQKSIESAAVAYALDSSRGRSLTATALATLPLKERFEPEPEHEYRVDPKSRRLVAHETFPRLRSSAASPSTTVAGHRTGGRAST